MKKVLIVDDEPTILLSLSHLLSSRSVSVFTTGKIEEAEEVLSTHGIDLVLADIRLSGVHGYEGLSLLDYVKEKNPDARVIIMTAYGTAEMKEAAYEKGAYHYYEKPVDINDLLEKVAACGIPIAEPRKTKKNLTNRSDELQGKFQF
ncbi:MAG: response regulator [Nitrospiraceae bacterium]|nr:response regulator [Nitrospiraceae bacterium]MDA8327226.1 response regulator [Nitrospiraceae bacterium]